MIVRPLRCWALGILDSHRDCCLMLVWQRIPQQYAILAKYVCRKFYKMSFQKISKTLYLINWLLWHLKTGLFPALFRYQ